MSTTLDSLVARAEGAGVLRAYKVNEVPETPDGDYIVLTLGEGARASTRVDGRSPSRSHPLTVQIFAATDDGITTLVGLVEDAFYDQLLNELDGEPFCWRELQIGPTRDPDGGGLLYVLHTYRFQS